MVPSEDVPKLATTPKLVCLKPHLDDYHQRRADKHGYIYYATHTFGFNDEMVEAKSLATGALVTLFANMLEEQDE